MLLQIIPRINHKTTIVGQCESSPDVLMCADIILRFGPLLPKLKKKKKEREKRKLQDEQGRGTNHVMFPQFKNNKLSKTSLL